MIHDGKPVLRGCHSGPVRSGSGRSGRSGSSRSSRSSSGRSGPVLVGPVPVGLVPVGPVPVGLVPVGPANSRYFQLIPVNSREFPLIPTNSQSILTYEGSRRGDQSQKIGSEIDHLFDASWDRFFGWMLVICWCENGTKLASKWDRTSIFTSKCFFHEKHIFRSEKQ